VCHQTGGLVQREIEARGIPTISLSNNPTNTARVRPPRWAVVRFPRGSMLGEPGNRDKQTRVLRDVLEALLRIDSPGGHVELPYRWEAAPIMWRGKPLVSGSND
jgi:hypothetical protein